jgi:hypothetical protein
VSQDPHELGGDAGSGPFGAPIELPWWVVPLAVPPVVAILLAPFVRAPASGRVLDVAASVGMVWVLLRVATRVRSTSMQSVWISAAYAFWLFAVLLWAVEAHG